QESVPLSAQISLTRRLCDKDGRSVSSSVEASTKLICTITSRIAMPRKSFRNCAYRGSIQRNPLEHTWLVNFQSRLYSFWPSPSVNWDTRRVPLREEERRLNQCPNNPSAATTISATYLRRSRRGNWFWKTV